MSWTTSNLHEPNYKNAVREPQSDPKKCVPFWFRLAEKLVPVIIQPKSATAEVITFDVWDTSVEKLLGKSIDASLFDTGEQLTDQTDRCFPVINAAGMMAAQTVPSGPSERDTMLPNVLLAAINASLRKVVITTPYFVPDEPTLMALLMAAIGIYGLIQYSIATRTHEIGIRMAVGARSGTIFRMVIGEGFKLSDTWGAGDVTGVLNRAPGSGPR